MRYLFREYSRAGMRRVPAALVLVAGLTLVVAVAGALRGSAREPELGTLLDRVVAAGAPGVLVVEREETTVRTTVRGFGHRDGTGSVRSDTRFRVGSVTKTFVAALVLELAQDGRLGLDDSVERWLPGLVPRGREVTVRHLLAHRSGLFDYVEDPRVLRDPWRRWTPRQLVSIAVDRPGERATPGRTFAYSSTNYLVLGLIAEKAGGAPLERQLRERLFVPLGLRRTSFVPGAVGGEFVHGYRAPSHRGVVTGPPVDVGDEPAWWAWAAGAVVSTADDVQRFFAALLRGRVLRPSYLREMERVLPAGRLGYGLGLATFPTPCGRAWGHTGNVQGTITVAWNARDASRQLVVMVNTYPLSPELEAAVRDVQDAAFCTGASSSALTDRLS